MDQPPLFEEYPELRKQIPWVSLIPQPTPVQQLTSLQNYLNTQEAIWVKLDNLTSETYGGNKVRKLEFLLGEALKKQKQTITTIGALGTNHGLATTIHGRTYNLRARLYLMEQPITPFVLRNLKLMYYFGAELIFAPNAWSRALRFNYRERFFRPSTYWVPVGGSTRIGVLGYVNAVLELKRQIEAGRAPEPSWIFVATGSLGTIAGIELGLQLAGMQTQVKGIYVAPNLRSVPNKIDKLIHSTLSFLKQSGRMPKITLKPRYEVTTAFAGSSYGAPTQAGTEATQLAKQLEKLVLEPTYTAKTFAGLIDSIRKGARGPFLYWHTFNSVDLSAIANQVDYWELPAPFHRFFKTAPAQ